MHRHCGWLLTVVLSFAVPCPLLVSPCRAQESLDIPAGSPEDKDLKTILDQTDNQKKISMYQDFLQKYSSNPAAVAFANWQISQTYQAEGDLKQALDYGDKALATSPHSIDILVSQAGIAQQLKDSDKLVDYCSKGGEACTAIGKQAKPEGMSDADFAARVGHEKDVVKDSCNFFESAAFNAIGAEKDAKTRMTYIEKFTAAFPESNLQDQVTAYALYTLGPGQLNDHARLVSYGEKTLAANPRSLPALLLLANSDVDDPNPADLSKAIAYSQKVIEYADANAPDADKARKLSAGVAHSTLGYAYMKQNKTEASIPELKAATALLKGQDETAYATALYRLGFAYAKLNKTTDARAVLQEAANIPGPVQAPSQDLLAKVNAARAKGK
jgi:tetratricopeptide (TPR) repeat protein